MKILLLGLLAVLSCSVESKKGAIVKSDTMDTTISNYSDEIIKISSKVKSLDSYDVLFTVPNFLTIYENPISYLDSSIVFLASDFSTAKKKIAILSMNKLPTSQYIEFASKSLSLYEENTIGEDLFKLILTFSYNHRLPVLITEFKDMNVKNILNAAKNNPLSSKQLKDNIDNILSGEAYNEMKRFREQSGNN